MSVVVPLSILNIVHNLFAFRRSERVTKPVAKYKAFRDTNKGRAVIILAISRCTFSRVSSPKAEHLSQTSDAYSSTGRVYKRCIYLHRYLST